MAHSIKDIVARARPMGEGALDVLVGLDKRLIVVMVLLLAYGLVVVYSASLTISDASFARQLLGVGLGLLLFALCCHFDYRAFSHMARPLLVIDCLLIIAPLIPFLSYDANGITGWVRIPVINLTFQTSELAKPVTVLLVAAIASKHRGKIEDLREYLKLCAVLAIPFALILLQPDLGTGLVLLVSGAAVIALAGPKRSWVIATLVVLLLLVALVFLTDNVIDDMLGDERSLVKDYQLNRLLVFINPELDSSGAGYNLQQAMIAVGSGGLWGKGIGNASQAGSGFLPEAHTDFVFALLTEEFGFIGGIFLIACYVALVMSAIRIAQTCGNYYGKLVVAGIATMWTFQIFENVGMCLSLMPITGIPLPFVSFGSSSMIAQLACLGIVQSVHVHRTKMG